MSLRKLRLVFPNNFHVEWNLSTYDGITVEEIAEWVRDGKFELVEVNTTETATTLEKAGKTRWRQQ